MVHQSNWTIGWSSFITLLLGFGNWLVQKFISFHSNLYFQGVAPLSMLAVQAGQVLEQLTSSRDTLTFKSVGFVALSAVLSIVPVWYKRREHQRKEAEKQK